MTTDDRLIKTLRRKRCTLGGGCYSWWYAYFLWIPAHVPAIPRKVMVQLDVRVISTVFPNLDTPAKRDVWVMTPVRGWSSETKEGKRIAKSRLPLDFKQARIVCPVHAAMHWRKSLIADCLQRGARKGVLLPLKLADRNDMSNLGMVKLFGLEGGLKHADELHSATVGGHRWVTDTQESSWDRNLQKDLIKLTAMGTAPGRNFFSSLVLLRDRLKQLPQKLAEPCAAAVSATFDAYSKGVSSRIQNRRLQKLSVVLHDAFVKGLKMSPESAWKEVGLTLFSILEKAGREQKGPPGDWSRLEEERIQSFVWRLKIKARRFRTPASKAKKRRRRRCGFIPKPRKKT